MGLEEAEKRGQRAEVEKGTKQTSSTQYPPLQEKEGATLYYISLGKSENIMSKALSMPGTRRRLARQLPLLLPPLASSRA